MAHDDFLEYAYNHGFGDIHFKVDPKTGMKAIIAIHSTKLGPALGGCRFISYKSTNDAILDAMRLARGMSYKAALVNLPLGGGKSVVMKPEASFDRDAYFNSFGKFVQELNGRYITALDSGTQLSDMDIIANHTSYVASLSRYNGDPSPHTALGIYKGIEAAVLFKLDKPSLSGIHVAIQGMGHVGMNLARLLHKAGAKLSIADIREDIVKNLAQELQANIVSVDSIHAINCDVFSPCALGATLNDASIPDIKASIVAGAANNQLAHSYHGEKLKERGILYAPDYVINAGGLIFAAGKYFETDDKSIEKQIDHINSSLLQIFTRAHDENTPTNVIADAMAQEKLA